MALDVGERRIGVAIADELGTIASPLTTVQRGRDDLETLRRLACERGATTIVIGLPTSLSGREGPQAATVREFAAELEARVQPEIAVEFWDERLTTAVAERSLGQRGIKGKQRRELVDATAAAVILQGYLDSRRARTVRAGEG
ncbi:MAG: Holliday junction resolvase RuvX [Thermomicrobiales bacterium]